MKLTNAVLYAVLAAEAPNPKTDALAAKGPAAIAEALEAELAKAEKVGDTEHAESIKRHWADYLSERKERINDAKGGVIQTRQRRAINQGPAAVVEALTKTPNAGLEEAEKFGDKEHINSIEKHLADYASERRERIADAEGGHLDTRQAAAAGPDDRKARAGNVAAVEAALEQEFKEAEKYNDKEHEASLQKHLMDYLHMEHGLGRNRQNIADREGPRAEYEALLGQLHEAEKFHDVEHEASIEKHWRDYLGRVEGTTPAWDYSDDEAKAALEKAAFYHRHHVTRENAYPEARREHNDMRNQRAATCHMPLSTANDLKHEAGCRSGFSYGQWSLVYNACSFGIASMASAMLFVWLMLLGNQVHKKFKPALGINGLVTGIAAYHYFRIFNSWCDSFDVFYDGELDRFVVNSTGLPFNDAYRYVDWLLTVPLLLIELILVMQLPAEESSRKMWTLGAASGFMVAFGYPGEVRDDPAGRWFYWAVSMCPFMYVLYELYFGLAEATKKHAPSVASLIASARYITAISWLTYPFVYMLKGIGLGGSNATAFEQIGYSFADIVAKAVFGIVIWRIAHEKTMVMEQEGLLK
jgi:bacteriorhodopsin